MLFSSDGAYFLIKCSYHEQVREKDINYSTNTDDAFQDYAIFGLERN
ncbi:hypothetical protein [Calothrix sp. CCY 0018]